MSAERDCEWVQDNECRPSGIWIVLVSALLCWTSMCPKSSGDFRFLGIGNDGYYRDVSGLWDALQVQPGWENAHSQLLSNRTGSEMISDISWLEQAGPGDVAVWYYSGHGGSVTIDENEDEQSVSASNSYDESIGLLFTDDWAIDDYITNALGQINSSVPIVAVMDTCHAGGFFGGDQDLNRLTNIVAILSCEENQTSLGGYPYSVFTTGLIDGLGPDLSADINGDGVLYSDEWFSYAATHMSSGSHQDPTYWASPGVGNVAIVVPEPGTLCLLVIAGLALLRRRTPTCNGSK